MDDLLRGTRRITRYVLGQSEALKRIQGVALSWRVSDAQSFTKLCGAGKASFSDGTYLRSSHRAYVADYSKA